MKKQTQTRLPFFGLPKIVRFLRPYRREVFCLVFFAVLGGVVDTVLPLFQQYAITNFVAQETTAGIPLFILFYVLVLGFGVLCNTVSSYSCCAVEMYTARDMRGYASIICRR